MFLCLVVLLLLLADLFVAHGCFDSISVAHVCHPFALLSTDMWRKKIGFCRRGLVWWVQLKSISRIAMLAVENKMWRFIRVKDLHRLQTLQ